MASRSGGRKRGPSVSNFNTIFRRVKNVKNVVTQLSAVIYGRPGSGKTTLACTFPKPALLVDCNEKGTDSVRDVSGLDVLVAENWEDLDSVYWGLKKGRHKYKTVIIDTMSQVQDMCIVDELGGSIEPGKIGNWGTMTKRNWGSVSTKLKTFISEMRDLPMNVVFTAHERVFMEDENEDETSLTPTVGPRLMPSVASTLNGAVMLIGMTFVQEKVTKVKTRRRGVVEKRSIGYALRIGPSSVYTTKIRKPKSVELPETIVDPTYRDIMDMINGTLDEPNQRNTDNGEKKHSRQEGKEHRLRRLHKLGGSDSTARKRLHGQARKPDPRPRHGRRR